MATTDTGDTSDEDPTPELGPRLADASFVHLFTAPDGDAIAATGILGAVLAQGQTPFQVSVVESPRAASDRVAEIGGDTTPVGVGVDIDGPTIDGLPRSVAAYEIATEHQVLTERVGILTLAGAMAAGAELDDTAGIEDATRVASARPRPGVTVPTTDLATGLAHSTLVHTSFSGRPSAATELVDDIADGDPMGGRALASAVALTVCRDDSRPVRGTEAVDRIVRPLLIDHRFQTVGGFADVLNATAATAPGTGVALALGRDVDEAMTVWRDHGTAVQAAVRGADWRRYADLIVVDVEAPVTATARLLRDFRAPEPAVLVRGPERVALATTDRDAREWLTTATDPASVTGRPRLASTTDDDDGLSDRLREAT